jgi:hypothetical protein
MEAVDLAKALLQSLPAHSLWVLVHSSAPCIAPRDSLEIPPMFLHHFLQNGPAYRIRWQRYLLIKGYANIRKKKKKKKKKYYKSIFNNFSVTYVPALAISSMDAAN